MTRVFKKWMSALLALFMLMTAMPASLAEEMEEPAAVEEVPEAYSAPEPEPIAVTEAEPAPGPAEEPQPEVVEVVSAEEVSEMEAPATKAPVEEAPAETEAAVEMPTEVPTGAPTPEPVVIAQLLLGDMGNLIYVPYGTLEADLPLYAMLPAVYSNGTSGQVSVSWSCVGDSLGGNGYVSNHEDASAVFYFQPTPVGAACDPAMLLPLVTVAYESVPMAVAENPDIEIAGDIITIARGAKVTTDDIVNEPGYDPSFLVRNQGTIAGGSAEIHNSIHGGTITGGTYYGDVNDAPQYVLRISGGEFYGNIGDHDGEAVDAYVYISGGSFHSDVRARNLVISGGTFGESGTVYLQAVGTISGGTFYGTVINHLGILNGPNSVPEFYGRVVNAQAPYGQIYGGRFYGEVDNSAGGKITDGAEFVRGTINNSGTIDAGTSTFSADVRIINAVEGKIVGGTFGCSVINSGSISGGVYNAPVSNLGMISGGAFYSDMSNEGTIAGADLYGAMTLNTGTISTEGITVDVENGRVIISGGTSVTTDLILAAIDDDDETRIAVVENNGTITGGSAAISCAVDNDNGTISGGVFDGPVSGGKITNGTFNGGVNPDGKGIASISGGTFNGNVGAALEGHVFISGGTFHGEVQARNLVISGGAFSATSNVVVNPVGGISGGTFDGMVTSSQSIEGGTFNGKVVNKSTIFGGVFNGGIDNYGEITYISEYTLTQDIVDGKAVSQTFSVTQTYLNCAVNDFGGCIYGPVKYGDGFNSTCATYVMASITEDDGSVKIYQGKDFPRNGNVLDGLRALDASQNVNSAWTRTGGGEIGQSETFAADAEDNRFTRRLNWEISNGVLELRTNEALDRLPEEGSYKSVHIWAGVTVDDVAWNVSVVNDGTIAGGSFREAAGMYETYVTNNGAITGGSFDAVVKNNGTISGGSYERHAVNDGTVSGGTFNGEVTNNGAITGAELNALVSSNVNSSIKQTNFGPNARFQEAPRGQVEVNYTADGVTYYAAYGTIMYSKLRSLRNEPYTDWCLISGDGSVTTVGVSTQLTLNARTFETRKRVTPEIVWPTAGVLPYGEKLSSARLTSTDRFGTFSWKTPNVIPTAGTHSFTVVYTPTYPTTYDYSGVSFERDITVEVKRNAVVIALSSGQTKYYGEKDPTFGVAVTGLRNGDKLNYTIRRAPGEAIGTYEITAELGDNPNYDVTVHNGKFTIMPKPIPYTVEGSLPDEVYTGSPITPKPVIVVDGVTLVEGADYTLSYYNNIDAGNNAYLLVQGIGNYAAVRRMSFRIVKASATVAVNSVTKVLGEADPVLTAEVTGVKGGGGLNYTLKRAVGENAGTYAITVVPGDNPNYDVKTVSGTLTIAPKQLPAAEAVAAQVYTGKALTPKPVVKDGGKLLAEGADYSLSYSGNTNAGTGSITITGKGNYTGKQTLNFKIEKVAGAVLTVNSASKAFGAADPALTATVSGLPEGVKLNYTLKRAAGENAGAYAITAEVGENANIGSVKVVNGTLTITPKQLPAPAAVAAQTYTGKSQTPKPVIKDGSKTLAEGADYTSVYNNNINAGTASIVITGKGNYSGSRTANFTINKVAGVVVTAKSVSKALGAADPTLTATVSGLPEGGKVNYTLKRAVGENAGSYAITVVPGDNPNYDVKAVSGTLTITPKQLPAAEAVAAQVYTGKALTPKPVVKDGGKVLVEGTDYSLSYSGNTNAGTASVTITGKGNYTGAQTLRFEIEKAEGVTVAANSVSKALGAADPTLTATVSGLPEGAKLNYTLKRAAGENAGTYTISVVLGDNPNLNVKAVDGTLTITPKQLPAPAAVAAQTYTGKALTPKPVIKDGSKTLAEGTDYTLAYTNNLNAGTASIVITGKGNYSGSRTANFTINKVTGVVVTAKSVSKALGAADPTLAATVSGLPEGGKVNYTLKRAVGENAGTYAITVVLGDNPNYVIKAVSGTLTIGQRQLPAAEAVAAQVYTGKALTPKPVMKDGGKVLMEGTDYSLSYSGNTNAGTASVTITGKGNYSGSRTVNFTINKASGVVVTAKSLSKAFGAADPTLTATVSGLPEGVKLNYTLKRTAGESAGTYVISAVLGDNPNLNVKAVDGTLTITPKQLPAPAAVEAQTYTGKALTPKPVIKDGGKVLVEGTDYTLAYNNNLNAGTASIVITGKGNYSGSRTLNFTINRANAVVVTVDSVSKTFGAADPALTATVTGLPEGAKVNYSLKRAAGENAGSYTISVALGDNPNFNVQTVNGVLTIAPKQLPEPAAVAGQVYTGKAQTPKPVIMDGGKALTEGTDYTLTYANNLNAGTASIVATGKGNYDGGRTVNFTIDRADAVVTVNAASKFMGEADPDWDVEVTGVLDGESINYTLERAKGETAGTYAITVKLGSNPNYNVTVQNGELTILADPSSVTLSADKLTLDAGKSQKLTATLLPKDATSEITYSTSDEAVATVAADGTVKAVKAGVATITATTANQKTATCQVTVKPVAEKITIGSGEKRTLTVADKGTRLIAYISSNAAIAAVEASGAVTAKKAGSATVTATSNGIEIAKWEITVTAAPSKLTVSAASAKLGVGETLKLTASADVAVDSEISWTSSKTGVATVDAGGVVTAVKAGSATITATTYNGKKASCKVTVNKAPTSIALSVSTVTLGCGDSAAVKTTLSSGSAGAITYTSTNEKIATLRDGKIIAGSTAGTATVTAKTYNGKKATCKVTVRPAPKAISLGKDLALGVKQSVTLKPVLTSGSKATLTYASSNSGVASVTAAGKVTAKKTGTATITVTAHNGVKASIKVTVNKAPTKVTMSETKAKLKVGKQLKLKATLSSGSVSDLTWSSNKASVATVDANGVVTARKAGTVTITVKTYNGKTATCKITVEK